MYKAKFTCENTQGVKTVEELWFRGLNAAQEYLSDNDYVLAEGNYKKVFAGWTITVTLTQDLS